MNHLRAGGNYEYYSAVAARGAAHRRTGSPAVVRASGGVMMVMVTKMVTEMVTETGMGLVTS